MSKHRDKGERDDVQTDANGDVTQMSGDLGPGADEAGPRVSGDLRS